MTAALMKVVDAYKGDRVVISMGTLRGYEWWQVKNNHHAEVNVTSTRLSW